MRIIKYLLGVNRNIENNFVTSSEKDTETIFETNEGKHNYKFKSIGQKRIHTSTVHIITIRQFHNMASPEIKSTYKI